MVHVLHYDMEPYNAKLCFIFVFYIPYKRASASTNKNNKAAVVITWL